MIKFLVSKAFTVVGFLLCAWVTTLCGGWFLTGLPFVITFKMAVGMMLVMSLGTQYLTLNFSNIAKLLDMVKTKSDLSWAEILLASLVDDLVRPFTMLLVALVLTLFV